MRKRLTRSSTNWLLSSHLLCRRLRTVRRKLQASSPLRTRRPQRPKSRRFLPMKSADATKIVWNGWSIARHTTRPSGASLSWAARSCGHRSFAWPNGRTTMRPPPSQAETPRPPLTPKVLLRASRRNRLLARPITVFLQASRQDRLFRQSILRCRQGERQNLRISLMRPSLHGAAARRRASNSKASSLPPILLALFGEHQKISAGFRRTRAGGRFGPNGAS